MKVARRKKKVIRRKKLVKVNKRKIECIKRGRVYKHPRCLLICVKGDDYQIVDDTCVK